MLLKNTDYNKFAKTFANSRQNMKWEEIYYFFLKIGEFEGLNILDIGCGSGRLINHIKDYFDGNFFYTGIDSSSDMILEAKKEHYNYDFLCQNMTSINLNNKYDLVFFIASFHHLKTIEDRIQVLQNLKKYINSNSKIFMTNWDLRSSLNFDKYKNDIISNSQNEFGSYDYNIKIGEYYRFYHSFSLEELEYLFQKTGYEIIENRLFNNGRNFVSIIK